MKKQSLLLLLFVAFGSLVWAQTTAPAPNKPKSSLRHELNPNTDPKNQQAPTPASPASTPAPASRNTATKPAARPNRTSPTPPSKSQEPAAVPAPAPVQPAPAVKEEPSSTPPPSTTGTEKQPTESAAAASKRKLIADGYMVCMTHPDYGKVYCDEAQAKMSKGRKAKYFYIDEDGIAIPIDKSAVIKAPEGEKQSASKANPVTTPQQPDATPAPETGFRVVEVLVRATPANATGDCPQRIGFTARISAIGGAGTVSYKWLRNDGASGPVETITFDSPGSKNVETYWQLGGPGSNYQNFWQQIEIFDPKPFLSNKAFFTLTCK